jgi:hypothetical protein
MGRMAILVGAFGHSSPSLAWLESLRQTEKWECRILQRCVQKCILKVSRCLMNLQACMNKECAAAGTMHVTNEMHGKMMDAVAGWAVTVAIRAQHELGRTAASAFVR